MLIYNKWLRRAFVILTHILLLFIGTIRLMVVVAVVAFVAVVAISAAAIVAVVILNLKREKNSPDGLPYY